MHTFFILILWLYVYVYVILYNIYIDFIYVYYIFILLSYYAHVQTQRGCFILLNKTNDMGIWEERLGSSSTSRFILIRVGSPYQLWWEWKDPSSLTLFYFTWGAKSRIHYHYGGVLTSLVVRFTGLQLRISYLWWIVTLHDQPFYDLLGVFAVYHSTLGTW